MSIYISRFLIALIFLMPSPSLGVRVDLNDLLTNDNESTRKIGMMLQEIEECQIGGTHTYGNSIIIKQGPKKGILNSSILIINPDLKAHDLDNQTVLSIVGSGFDRHLLMQLEQVCEKFQIQFERLYINNVVPGLPVPDDSEIPDDITKYQKQLFQENQPAFRLCDFTDLAFIKYSKAVIKGDEQWSKPSLYSCYARLLKKGGEFWFKSAQSYNPIIPFLKAFMTTSFYKDGKPSVSLEKDQKNFHIYVNFLNEIDEVLSNKIRNGLNKIGDRFVIDQCEYTPPSDDYAETHSRSFIYSQIKLLTHCSFDKIEVIFGQFENYGYTQLRENQPYKNAYSMIIKAKKNKS